MVRYDLFMSDSTLDNNQEPWFKSGLSFRCTRCGNCCTGSPGAVNVNDIEIEALAHSQDMANEEFRQVFTRKLRGGDISLRERSNGDCIFFDREKGCRVYEHRPKQCRTWPFWSSVVYSSENWHDAAKECPGMNAGNFYSASEIQAVATDDGTGTQRRKAK